MIYASGKTLSPALDVNEIAHGLIYPDISRIREISVIVARDVIRTAQEDNVDREIAIRDMRDADLEAWIKARMYDPHSEVRNLESQIGSLSSLSPHVNRACHRQIKVNTAKL
ncbi:uncharacterized protein N7529_001007 [Penicillium soppii]|uniref:uncharacterized protein n=1 Tax=Penicillium soppii TaxID=69789 RepID=UPI0025494655|nr:uncharacterized protein N7529_001007 [Penicillium soppii]KAJ5882335.1 hypothetical protein N7529_001007 [Penicillium soppii]